MQYRKLGRNGPTVSAIGLGCMSIGIADTYTSSVKSDDDAVALINHALKLGITMLDTADIYGNSERTGRARRSRGTIATRSCWRRSSVSLRDRGAAGRRSMAARRT